MFSQGDIVCLAVQHHVAWWEDPFGGGPVGVRVVVHDSAVSLAVAAAVSAVSEPVFAIPRAFEVGGKGAGRDGGNAVHQGFEGCRACGDDADVELQAVLRVSTESTVFAAGVKKKKGGGGFVCGGRRGKLTTPKR